MNLRKKIVELHNFIIVLEYANRLADEGRFQEAIQEIVDLFVLKYQADDDKLNEDDYNRLVYIISFNID